MPLYNGAVKKYLTPISKKLTIVPADKNDTVTVYNNDGSNGCKNAMQLYADLKQVEQQYKDKYNIKCIDVFNPSKGTIPQIMSKKYQNADGTPSESIYLMLADSTKLPKASTKGIDIDL